ncbi:MAG: GntR family transcriptional regulator [Alphaproteobacteria bacterium]|nr:GntR family transcriptional regulator [Alphaproteobacteria bacterium]
MAHQDQTIFQATDRRLPAYLRLRDDLAARVAREGGASDVALPSENQMLAETGLSQGTSKEAMQMLVDEGLLERD